MAWWYSARTIINIKCLDYLTKTKRSRFNKQKNTNHNDINMSNNNNSTTITTNKPLSNADNSTFHSNVTDLLLLTLRAMLPWLDSNLYSDDYNDIEDETNGIVTPIRNYEYDETLNSTI